MAASPLPRTAISAAILAGGAGLRLGGRDKGLELLSGRPLIAWVIAAIKPQVTSLSICANRHTQEYSAYSSVLIDRVPGFRGPLAGIATALEHADHDWVLTVPVDCPNPPSDLAARLYASARQGTGAVAHDGIRRQPLFALYSRTLASTAMQALHDNVPVWQFQDNAGIAEVNFSDERFAFTNLNAVADFISYEAIDHDHSI